MFFRLKTLVAPVATVLAVLALAACGPAAPESAPEDPAQDAVESEVPAAEDDASTPVLSDEEVMASMTCEPLAEDELAAMSAFGLYDRGASVEVCEKDGVAWRAVVLERTEGGASVEARASLLTDAPDLSVVSDDDTWIEVGGDAGFDGVDWGHDDLVRLQSALTLARKTLASGEEAPVAADEAIMASMTCELLDVSAANDLTTKFGYFDRAASVEVGEKDGTTWWVVVFEWDDDSGVVDSRKAYLTDGLGLPSRGDGTWIELRSSDPWHDVDWDRDMLVRGQSALELARDTLDAG